MPRLALSMLRPSGALRDGVGADVFLVHPDAEAAALERGDRAVREPGHIEAAEPGPGCPAGTTA